MAEAVLFNLATDVLKLAGSITYSKSGLVCGVRDELNNLKDTVETIQGVLLDAETKRWHKKQVENWLRKLKEVLYDIQDLLDDVATEDLRREVTPGNNTWKAVRVFFSKSNQLLHRLKVANKTQELWKRLDRIKEERKFDLEERHSEETMAIVGGKKPEISNPDEQIIGRGKDKENIKQKLFDSSSSQSVSFVAIAGKGGLGKTALAQLVYNDWDVRRHFELQMWVCVSVVFDVNSIIKEICKSATRKDHENKSIPELQILLHQTLNEKKYLLVLDDVWNEGRHRWLGLGNWLESDQKGSKILVTTRSHKVAEVMDAKSVIYDLPGLSNGQSWKLFRKMALGDGTEPLDPELEKTGRDIVKKCVGVPLAIRTMGCLLYGKEKDLWLRYKECELPEIPEIDEDNIEVLRVLKFSYDHLASSLKHCFAYCSLFPKDHIYKKDVMIHLWVAQGFIESHNEKDNLEEVAENYLSQLIWRSFLDVQEKGKDGKVLCFKMHDLMHDLAQKVAGNECKIVNFKRGDNNRSMRHASFISEISSKEKMVSLIKTSNLRTFLYLEGKSSTLHSPKVFSECKHCRALGLGNINIPLPPSSLGKLKQLRFLDISANRSIRSLPNSITDLVNLQVLRLFECMNLETFPRDLRKLVKLKYLLIEKCRSLSHLPPLSELPSLRTLIFKQLDALKFLQWTSDPKQSNTTRPFFPSLEGLSLLCCGSLEGWWGGKHRLDHSWPYFPELRFMEIRCCPCLSFVPPFLQVEYFTKMSEQQLMANPICPSQGTAESTFVAFSNLKHLYLDRMDLEPSVLNTLLRVASNLESLWLTRFNLRSLLGGMQHLSSL